MCSTSWSTLLFSGVFTLLGVVLGYILPNFGALKFFMDEWCINQKIQEETHHDKAIWSLDCTIHIVNNSDRYRFVRIYKIDCFYQDGDAFCTDEMQYFGLPEIIKISPKNSFSQSILLKHYSNSPRKVIIHYKNGKGRNKKKICIVDSIYDKSKDSLTVGYSEL